jgi:LexA-binding, inner membrane-associated putative hydrolase
MPITPLHFGLLPVVHKLTKRKVSDVAFVVANVVADIPVMMNVMGIETARMGGPEYLSTLHETASHTFSGALVIGLVLGVMGLKKPGWMLGCLLGSLTHVALDMFVHSDVSPFAPLTNWNPFYFEYGHAVLSVLLTAGLAALALQYWDRRKADRQTLI